MGRKITIVSGKGGVGKTTITGNLGVALAQAGKKVCLIDADVAMANLSLLFGMQSSPITLHDVLLGESDVHDAMYDGPGGIKFIPSGLSLENYRRVDTERLAGIVDSIAKEFDFILLDAPAGIEKNVLASIAAAEEVLLVTMPNSPSVADVIKTKTTSNKLGVKCIGVVLNFMRNEKGEMKPEEISKMLDLSVYGLIPFDDEVRRSFMQDPVVATIIRSPNSSASVAIRSVAAKLTGQEMKGQTIIKNQQGFFGRVIKGLTSIFKR